MVIFKMRFPREWKSVFSWEDKRIGSPYMFQSLIFIQQVCINDLMHIFVFREIEIYLWELKYLKIPEVVWFSSRAVRITLITRQNLHFHRSMCIHNIIGYLWGYVSAIIQDSLLWSDFSLWNPTPTGPRRRKRRIWSFDGKIQTTLRIQLAADVLYA